MPAPSSPVVVAFPLRGEWVAVRTPAHKVPSHGNELFGQRYVFDSVRPDHRRGLHLQPAGALLGGRTRDCYGWGQPVYAAVDGRVVATVDGVPERARVQVLREVAAALRTTVGFDLARSGFAPVAGNHVIVQGTKGFTVFAPWRRGRCRCAPASRCGRGADRPGRPHRQLDSAARALPADGRGRVAARQGHPVRVRGLSGAACRWMGAGRGGVHGRGERIRSVPEATV